MLSCVARKALLSECLACEQLASGLNIVVADSGPTPEAGHVAAKAGSTRSQVPALWTPKATCTGPVLFLEDRLLGCSWAAITKYLRPGILYNRQAFCLSSGGREVQDQGASMVRF